MPSNGKRILAEVGAGALAQGVGAWNSGATVYWNGIGKVFKFAFNDIYRIDGVSLSIDNNDTYALEYSTDDRIWSALFSVGANLGEIGWGMDTMSTVATDPEYIPLIAFSPVQARYVRIAAVQGDNSYAIGEVAFLGTRVEQQPPFPPASVPEPGMLALLAAAIASAKALRKLRLRALASRSCWALVSWIRRRACSSKGRSSFWLNHRASIAA